MLLGFAIWWWVLFSDMLRDIHKLAWLFLKGWRMAPHDMPGKLVQQVAGVFVVPGFPVMAMQFLSSDEIRAVLLPELLKEHMSSNKWRNRLKRVIQQDDRGAAIFLAAAF